jgi:hypothetical protein
MCRHQGQTEQWQPGARTMLDRSLREEFENYRKTLAHDDARRTFDERIESLLSQHGIDYVRGYVDALRELSCCDARVRTEGI